MIWKTYLFNVARVQVNRIPRLKRSLFRVTLIMSFYFTNQIATFGDDIWQNSVTIMPKLYIKPTCERIGVVIVCGCV